MSGTDPPSEQTAIVRRRLLVEGRVQGVGFRASCARRATNLGVSGWVRNLPDDRVEVLAEGSPAAVEALVTWCRKGPPAARVDRVMVAEEEVQGERGFRAS